MFKTLTSPLRFYWHLIMRSPKRFNIAMNPMESTAVATAPLFIFLVFVFLSIIFGSKLAILFPLAIPIVLGNMFLVHHVGDEGYRIKREQDRIRREAEELRYENEKRRQREEERKQREEARRREEELDRILREHFERMRKKREQEQRQQQYQNRQQRQQSASNNNMANAMKLLGLSEGFTEKDVKKAYRRLSKIHHPDVGGKEVNFLKLKKAYDYVMDRI
jgi:Skp family chaperone for outer membrane proteins